jgi:hypothetical protein
MSSAKKMVRDDMKTIERDLLYIHCLLPSDSIQYAITSSPFL